MQHENNGDISQQPKIKHKAMHDKPKPWEKYLQEVWPTVKSAWKEYGISCDLNLVEGSMTISTTRKTRDPFVIIKARDHIKLLSRSFPVHQGQISTSFFTLIFMSIPYEISVAFQRVLHILLR
ncbi:hypothetical protein SO802_019166 [Lithocarpus litseifolius]|uniref:KRR-R motif-containing protein 1 n=1 Tax=Lithocarpus litseifolius TaxID=425828 RepID=A0AAW2CNF9_9ROSI